MDMESILMIVGIVVLFGVAGGCVFAIIQAKGLLRKMDTELEPKLDELKVKTGALALASKQSEALMESVNVTLDSVDIELVELDGKLNKLAGITGTVTNVMEAVPEAAGQVKTSVKTQVKNQVAKVR